MSAIADNLKQVQEHIAAACLRAKRDPANVTLVAVSKTHPPETILAAIAAGLQHFGENRVEESNVKIPQVNQQASTKPIWHMVGHIQSRKAKLVPPLFQVVHSVDSLKLADKLSASAIEMGKMLDILLEINVSGETSKSGFQASQWQSDPAVLDSLCAEVQSIAALPGLRVSGLMTMAPVVSVAEAARPVFNSLAGLREALSTRLQLSLPELSMGMTDDYPVAIEEGATIIRIGRAIFGERRE